MEFGLGIINRTHFDYYLQTNALSHGLTPRDISKAVNVIPLTLAVGDIVLLYWTVILKSYYSCKIKILNKC